MRGYFEIGIINPKTPTNVGTLWRSAYQLGATGIFTVGRRYPKQTSDTTKTWRHVPFREFVTWNDFEAARPYSSILVGVEIGGKSLADFHHPERAIYLLGAEDHGLPKEVLARCQNIVEIESVRTASYNVAVAGSIVMHHRLLST